MGTLSALVTDSSEGAFLPTHLFPVFPQHTHVWPPAHPVLHDRGVWGGTGLAHFTPGGQPSPQVLDIFEKNKNKNGGFLSPLDPLQFTQMFPI